MASTLKDEYIAGAGLSFLLSAHDNLVGAEIGVDRGVTSQHLLEKLNIKTYYCIDPWVPYDGKDMGSTHTTVELADAHYNEAMKRIEPFKSKVVVLRMPSAEAVKYIPDDSLDFLFIDGCHDYEHVRQDCELYWPKVKYRGLFAGHDFSHLPVQYALKDFFEGKPINNVKLSANDVWYVLRTM